MEVKSGYSGGDVPNPSYEQICGKKTGHAEVVKITFNPDVLRLQDIKCWGRKRGKDLSAVAIRRQRVCGANGKVWHRAEGVGGVSSALGCRRRGFRDTGPLTCCNYTR